MKVWELVRHTILAQPKVKIVREICKQNDKICKKKPPLCCSGGGEDVFRGRCNPLMHTLLRQLAIKLPSDGGNVAAQL